MTTWESLVSKFVKDARKSPNFNFEKTVDLIDANDQDGLIKCLLTCARDTFPLYLVPPCTEHDWIPLITEELNKIDYYDDNN